VENEEYALAAEVQAKLRAATAEAIAKLRLFSNGNVTTLLVEVRDSEPVASLEAPPLVVTEQDESYTLEVAANGSGLIKANTTFGALRALETFSQLLEYTPAGEVELWFLPIAVEDKPRWKHRALKLDTSRHFIPLTRIRNVIRGMATAKMNVLQWHILDGNSFPLESKLFPELSQKGAYCPTCIYTQADIKALVVFAQQHGVRIIPEMDIPSHSGFQFAMPEIVACPFYPGLPLKGTNGGSVALDPTLDATYSFLTKFLTEQAALFGDPLINVYGDEIRFGCWESNPAIVQWMSHHGMAPGDFQSLTIYFWRRFATEVAPAVFNATGVAVMVGAGDVDAHFGPPFEMPTWFPEGYPLPLTVEVWGANTLLQHPNGTLRKVLQTPHMQAIVAGAYYLDELIPSPFGDDTACQTDNPEVYDASYWVSAWRTFYQYDPVGDPVLTPAQKGNVIGLLARD
jgi:N-acetyl-beta-hexosaminidase